jgi:hypothetical protein
MNTKVRRIDLNSVTNLDEDIATLSDNMLAANFLLAASFLAESQLILIYQKRPSTG